MSVKIYEVRFTWSTSAAALDVDAVGSGCEACDDCADFGVWDDFAQINVNVVIMIIIICIQKLL